MDSVLWPPRRAALRRGVPPSLAETRKPTASLNPEYFKMIEAVVGRVAHSSCMTVTIAHPQLLQLLANDS